MEKAESPEEAPSTVRDAEVLRLSVGGQRFELLASTLLRAPPSSLPHRLALGQTGLCHALLREAGDGGPVLFFDRSPAAFAALLDGLRTGLLRPPPTLPEEVFYAELAAWELDPLLLPPRAPPRRRHRLPSGSEELEEEEGRASSLFLSISGPDDPLQPTSPPSSPLSLPRPNGLSQTANLPTPPTARLDMFSGCRLASFRRRIWAFLEDPQSSASAKIFSIVSVSFVLLSVLTLVIASLPECQDGDGEPHISLIIIEYFVIIWFTFEYLIRLVITSDRWAYVKSPLVIIDLIAIGPFYVEFLLWLCGVNNANLSNIKGALLVMRVLRVLRVARILRLARYSNGMKSCGETLRASYREVGMLIIFVCTMITMFSTTVYFMERDQEDTHFTSIPATFWWCIVTITTVGYGDIVPVTFGGRLVASLTSVCGVIVLAFPITVIVENFYRYYRREKGSSTSETPKEEDAPTAHIAHGYGMV